LTTLNSKPSLVDFGWNRVSLAGYFRNFPPAHVGAQLFSTKMAVAVADFLPQLVQWTASNKYSRRHRRAHSSLV
jgi:hypothetical protein